MKVNASVSPPRPSFLHLSSHSILPALFTPLPTPPLALQFGYLASPCLDHSFWGEYICSSTVPATWCANTICRLMRRVARITLRNNPHEYTVHEDLLCSSAMYFKNIWQPIRKKLEGECPFCHFDIVPEIVSL
jgi:hypothetical protein